MIFLFCEVDVGSVGFMLKLVMLDWREEREKKNIHDTRKTEVGTAGIIRIREIIVWLDPRKKPLS